MAEATPGTANDGETSGVAEAIPGTTNEGETHGIEEATADTANRGNTWNGSVDSRHHKRWMFLHHLWCLESLLPFHQFLTVKC